MISKQVKVFFQNMMMIYKKNYLTFKLKNNYTKYKNFNKIKNK